MIEDGRMLTAVPRRLESCDGTAFLWVQVSARATCRG